MSFRLSKRELAVDIGRLVNTLDVIPSEAAIKNVQVEGFYVEENKIILLVNLSGEYKLTS